jgi:hypothetical protein
LTENYFSVTLSRRESQCSLIRMKLSGEQLCFKKRLGGGHCIFKVWWRDATLFCLFFIFYNIHTVIHSITFIQYIHPSPFAEASLHFLVVYSHTVNKHEISFESFFYINELQEKTYEYFEKCISVGLDHSCSNPLKFLKYQVIKKFKIPVPLETHTLYEKINLKKDVDFDCIPV